MIDEAKFSPGAKYLLRSHPRGKDHSPIQYSCNVPYKALSIDMAGDCFLCTCDAWLPVSVGNILDFDTLEEVWGNLIAIEVQTDVSGQKFTYCAVDHCGIVNRDINWNHYRISINIDESCNLSCPSCRRELITHTTGPIFDQKQKLVNHFVKLINQFKHPLHLTMSGNGDPLASKTMRTLVLDWAPSSKQTIKLFTNGLLMSKLLPGSAILPRIKEFQISVDAGTKDVYEQVRRPAKFENLINNLEWLADNRHTADVYLQFCLSIINANDIINFANLCKHYKFNGNITKLDDWGTFDNFKNQSIIDNPSHSMYATAITQLRIVNQLPYITLNSYLKNIL